MCFLRQSSISKPICVLICQNSRQKVKIALKKMISPKSFLEAPLKDNASKSDSDIMLKYYYGKSRQWNSGFKRRVAVLDTTELTELPRTQMKKMQVKKQQFQSYMEQLTGCRLGKEYIKAVHDHPAYLISMQSTSCEMLGWMNHNLESRLPGEISTTSDIQMISL